MQINIQEQLDRAIKLLDEGKELETAESIFNALLNLDMNSPVLLFYLASVQLRKMHYASAIYLYKNSLAIEDNTPNASPVWNNLGYAYREQGMAKEAIECFVKALALKPMADYYANIGAMYVAQGIPDTALSYLNKAVEMEDEHQVAHWNKALCLLEKGDYDNGFCEYDHGFRTEDRKERRYYQDYNVANWNGTPGQTVIVYGEQGIGDEIMFASMLPDLMKDCTVIFDAHPRLANIFRHSFPNIPVYGTRKSKDMQWPDMYDVDAKIAIGSLGKFYRKKESDFPKTPYIKANPVYVEQIVQELSKLGDKPKIGVSWKGGTKKTGLNNRIIKLEQWLPIFQAIDATFISLQYTDTAEKEIEAFEKEHGFEINHYPEFIKDYDLTAALVANLDLVISVPQSVVHLAGAMGIPTFQLCPKKALWQMGVYGHDMPWYACVKNYWQSEAEEWAPVIEQVAYALAQLKEGCANAAD